MDLQLFFSWQMETDAQGFDNKSFLSKCIEETCDKVSHTGKLHDIKIKFTEGMRGSSGAVEVAREMFRKIDDCDIFVADLTTAQRLVPDLETIRNKQDIFFRYTPNCNVYGEYNRALGKYEDFDRQIILIANSANKTAVEDEYVIPFDTRNRRWPILFHIEDNSPDSIKAAKDELMPQLETAIRECASYATEYYNNRYSPFVTWYKQGDNGLLFGHRIKQTIVDKYKDRILTPAKTMRIIGPDDYKKAYIVFMAFEGSDYTKRYFYVDFSVESENSIWDTINKMLPENDDIFLVFDNCSNSNIDKAIRLQKKYHKNNHMIFLTSPKVNPIDSTLAAIKFNDVIDITDDLINSMEQRFLAVDIKDKDVQNFILQFCDNNEVLINLVLDSNRGIFTTDNLSEILTNSITSSQPSDIERTIWQSIALFDRIGYKGDRADELAFILSDKSITLLSEQNDFIINKCSALIKKAIKYGWVQEKGDTITIALDSLANQLTYEWFSNIDIMRFNRVLTAIKESSVKAPLLYAFRNRLNSIESNEETYNLVAELLRSDSTIDATNLQSMEGMLILESFAAANPHAVTAFLSRTINAMNSDQLRGLLFNNSRLVWLIEKLCYRAELFNQAAQMMLRLAFVEDDDTHRDATHYFTQLFPVFLPATCADLDTRIRFLQEHFLIPDHKKFIIAALNRALHIRNNLLLTGAEQLGGVKSEPYMPKSQQETITYLNQCLRMVLDEILSDNQYKAACIEILESHVISYCSDGYANIILPIIEAAAAHIEYNWPAMQEYLARHKHSIVKRLSEGDGAIYNNLLNKLTKMDLVSRFGRVEKELFNIQPRIDFKERILQKENTYQTMAEEAYANNSLTDDILSQLMCMPRISSHPFGNTLAKLMTPEEQISFVRRYLQLSNSNSEASNNILCDFIAELSNDVFDAILPDLIKARITNTIFTCFGYRGILPSSEKFQILHQAVANQYAPVEDFLNYFYRLSIPAMTDNVILDLLKVVQSHPNGFNTMIQICSFYLLNNNPNDKPELAEYIEKAMIEYMNSNTDILSSREACEIGLQLLQSGNRSDLAKLFNNEIIAYASRDNVVFFASYEIEQIYGILMKLYFDDIWPELSATLLSDDEHYMAYYHLKSMLGTSLIDNKTPILMEGGHWDVIFEWCKQNPNLAPGRIAGIIPAIGENNQFSPEAIQLIDSFANKPYVLNEISCSLESFGSIGSVIPYYEQRKAIYETLRNHPNEIVRLWAQQHINGIDQIIERESAREAER